MKMRLTKMIDFWDTNNCGKLIKEIQQNLLVATNFFSQMETYIRRTPEEHDSIDVVVENADFSRPNLIKTGYFIPLSCGHNGHLSLDEKTLLEIHLTNANMIST
jgi:hypothetical protein